MSSIYRVMAQVSWVLGLLILLLALVSKLMHLGMKLRVEPSTLLLAATTMFLCAIASRSLQK